MSYSDLLDRMKRNDTEAFLEMTDQYGWSVYSAIREKYSDHAVADRIYNETMNAFYQALSLSDAEDPLEALLCAFARQISPEKFLFNRISTEHENLPPKIQLCHRELSTKNTVRKRNGFCHWLGMLFAMIAISAVLWVIAGLLMEIKIIPYFDLGYSWFNANVMELF